MGSDEKFRKLRQILPDVSRETYERLQGYEALFHKWSKAFNLAAPSTLPDFWNRHILDSVQLANLREPCGVWVDLGSGGGLPGIVMAILMRESAGGIIHLVESNGKKAAFLRQALIETGGVGKVHSVRIEAAHAEVGHADVVTARALAPLSTLLLMAKPWINAGATALFHKGREYREEVKAAGDAKLLDLIEHQSAIDPQSTVLEIRSRSQLIGD
jgi:16S rRNA (guanine527-N7)-methyltransferase